MFNCVAKADGFWSHPMDFGYIGAIGTLKSRLTMMTMRTKPSK